MNIYKLHYQYKNEKYFVLAKDGIFAVDGVAYIHGGDALTEVITLKTNKTMNKSKKMLQIASDLMQQELTRKQIADKYNLKQRTAINYINEIADVFNVEKNVDGGWHNFQKSGSYIGYCIREKYEYPIMYNHEKNSWELSYD